MEVEPYDGNVPLAGPDQPKCEQIDDLLKLLATIRHRWGNTAIKYSIQWGGSALGAENAEKREIERLKKHVLRLKGQLSRALEKR